MFLKVTLCKMGLSRELIKYFSLFFFQDRDDGALSGKFYKVLNLALPWIFFLLAAVNESGV